MVPQTIASRQIPVQVLKFVEDACCDAQPMLPHIGHPFHEGVVRTGRTISRRMTQVEERNVVAEHEFQERSDCIASFADEQCTRGGFYAHERHGAITHRA
jgi:hypothetical protein